MTDTTSSFASKCASLTDLQRETLEVIADGRTHKEVAAFFDISVSAATQRIEVLRAKFGGITKAELARLHRLHRDVSDCKEFTGKISQLPEDRPSPPKSGWNRIEGEVSLADVSPVFSVETPWQDCEPRVVPEVLDGNHASSTRLIMAVGLAAGMLVVAIVLLAVANMIGEMF